MLSLLGMLLIGLVVGLIARAVKPGDDKLGWIMTALLGIACLLYTSPSPRD